MLPATPNKGKKDSKNSDGKRMQHESCHWEHVCMSRTKEWRQWKEAMHTLPPRSCVHVTNQKMVRAQQSHAHPTTTNMCACHEPKNSESTRKPCTPYHYEHVCMSRTKEQRCYKDAKCNLLLRTCAHVTKNTDLTLAATTNVCACH